MRPRRKVIIGVGLLVAGILVAANGLVSGPRAFQGGWSSVALLVASGMLLTFIGALELREAWRSA